MPKGWKKGVKRGNYKKWVLTEKQIAYVKANSMKIDYIKMAKGFKIDPGKLLSFMYRNKIPRVFINRTPPAKGSYTHKKNPPKEFAKIFDSKVDRSSFTRYSNKQFVA